MLHNQTHPSRSQPVGLILIWRGFFRESYAKPRCNEGLLVLEPASFQFKLPPMLPQFLPHKSIVVLEGRTKETFTGFVKIWWFCFPLCLRSAGWAQKCQQTHQGWEGFFSDSLYIMTPNLVTSGRRQKGTRKFFGLRICDQWVLIYVHLPMWFAK